MILDSYTVTFQPSGKRVLVSRGEDILHAAIAAGVYINSSCGGDGVCGRCRVIVREGDTTAEPTGRLTDEEKAFNLSILYGSETNVESVIATLKQYPMNADHQVVLLKEAQGIKNIENLHDYIVQPATSTIFVICYKKEKFDKRTNFAKMVLNNCVVFESKKLYEDKVPQWIMKYLNEKGYDIHPEATRVLTEYLGNNLQNISNELNKLILNVEKNKEIVLADIEKNIGISRDYNVFELQNALGKKDIIKANKIVNYFRTNPKSNPFIMTIGSLGSYFGKIYMSHYIKDDSEYRSVLGVNPYFIKDYKEANRNYNITKTEQVLSLLHEYDLRSKGINNANINEGELLRELVYKILH